MHAVSDVIYGSFGRRAVAWLLDWFMLSAIAAIFSFIFFDAPVFRLVITDDGFSASAGNGWFDQIVVFIITVVMWVRVYATPGKLLMGCQVLDASTLQPLTWKQSVIRYLSYFVSALPLGLGFFWVIWDKRKQGFHDKIANTVVIVDSQHEWDDESAKSLDQLMSEVR